MRKKFYTFGEIAAVRLQSAGALTRTVSLQSGQLNSGPGYGSGSVPAFGFGYPGHVTVQRSVRYAGGKGGKTAFRRRAPAIGMHDVPHPPGSRGLELPVTPFFFAEHNSSDRFE